MKKRKEIDIDNFKYLDISISDDRIIINLKGDFYLSNSEAIDSEFFTFNFSELATELELNFSELRNYDSFLILFVNEIKELAEKYGIKLHLTNMNEEIKAFFKIQNYTNKEIKKNKRKNFYTFTEMVGISFLEHLQTARSMVEFIGIIFKTLFKSIIKPKIIRWKDFRVYFYSSGVAALPINILIIVLLGFITGWQGALQLKQFGADQYLSPLVGISIIRELGPIMVAIIIAGRSGSAFAAELGTMKLSDEIDALETMGFDKIAFLVIPRILALTLIMPMLVLLCDLMGVLGGLAAGLSVLNITITSYFSVLADNIAIIDISYGLVKAVVFGFFISVIGCFHGLQVSNNAESVGKNTTASVVAGIFMVIVIDALFVVLYDKLFM